MESADTPSTLVASCQTASWPAMGVPKMPTAPLVPETAQSVLLVPVLLVQTMPAPVKFRLGCAAREVPSSLIVWPVPPPVTVQSVALLPALSTQLMAVPRKFRFVRAGRDTPSSWMVCAEPPVVTVHSVALF